MVNSYEERCTLKASDGAEIVGTYSQPKSAPRGAYLLLHGISTDRNEYLQFLAIVASRLSAAGIATLRIDFRGHGESPVTPDQFTVGSQILDVLAAADYLVSRARVSRTNLFGCSFGSPPSIFAKAFRPNKFGKIIALAPVLDYRAVFFDPTSTWGIETFTNAAINSCIESGVGIELSESFKMYPALLASMLHSDILAAIHRIPELVVVHGTADGMVPFNISEQIAKNCAHVKLVPFENMEHGFTTLGDEDGTAPGTQENIDRIISILCDGVVQ